MHNRKIFIIGLPRTGTTSVCLSLLKLGYTTAHTAYTDTCLSQAQVIADTPVFCDYQSLDQRFPGAKFIYLTRAFELWLPSIQQLLVRMQKNLTRTNGGFNPILKRCYSEIFAPLTLASINDEQHLKHCYQQHYSVAQAYFAKRPDDLLTIDISTRHSYQALVSFLDIVHNCKTQSFPKVNIGRKVTYWNQVKHPLKIDSLLK